jgi:beta-galactosidase
MKPKLVREYDMNIKTFLVAIATLCSVLFICDLHAQTSSARERNPINVNWRFALGHATDVSKDFNHGTGYFSYLAKTGYGDGPAAANFDDRSWRTVNIPHDWAVEMPFDPNGSHSHGYKAVGPRFPQNSVGWYRHHFTIPLSDLGRRIRVEFEGIQRSSRVFINGFLVGEEIYGNLGQSYDISAYLNYGGDNVISVRADVYTEAGWYYEGAGIYRHAYLVKTDPVHVVNDGTAIVTEVAGDQAIITINTEIINEREDSAFAALPAANIVRTQTIFDARGKTVASASAKVDALKSGQQIIVSDTLFVKNPQLWSLNEPTMYKLVTTLKDHSGKQLDTYETPFGIRTIRFDPNEGFFLNGEHIKLKGSNNHEDHAGVGVATPDSLLEFRLQALKDMGQNAYRTSHAPASPALLDLADRMGILVIDENRLMGINELHLKAVERMIKRDRNHPSIILWSLGNEEWAIEGNIKGARIATTMQNFARRLDPSRLNTVAISGGWGGISSTIGVAGVNYVKQANTDQQHNDFPWQIMVGTEETTTQQTRGIYFENKALAHLSPREEGSSGGNAEIGWQYYAARPYLAGIFYWTGFDYRGEPTPYGFPGIASQFGILDTCGFPKDGYYYLKSWWTSEPVLKITPHWNWAGREGQLMDVRVYSNAEEVELLLNGKSMGKKSMPINGHLEWQVAYTPGELVARGYHSGKEIAHDKVATTHSAKRIQLQAHKNTIRADGRDVAVYAVSVLDDKGRVVPTADNNIRFDVKGPGKIIGVGNGNPSSLEPDVFVESTSGYSLAGDWQLPKASDKTVPIIFELTFDRPQIETGSKAWVMLSALGKTQTAVLNGKSLYKNVGPEKAGIELPLNDKTLKATGNTIRIEAVPYDDWDMREGAAKLSPLSVRIFTPAAVWQRKAFNGLAQVIVQSTGEPGQIILEAYSDDLESGKVGVKALKKM